MTEQKESFIEEDDSFFKEVFDAIAATTTIPGEYFAEATTRDESKMTTTTSKTEVDSKKAPEMKSNPKNTTINALSKHEKEENSKNQANNTTAHTTPSQINSFKKTSPVPQPTQPKANSAEKNQSAISKPGQTEENIAKDTNRCEPEHPKSVLELKEKKKSKLSGRTSFKKMFKLQHHRKKKDGLHKQGSTEHSEPNSSEDSHSKTSEERISIGSNSAMTASNGDDRVYL